MSVRDLKQQSVNSHNFAMIPRADIPRSRFPARKNLKTTISSAFLYPVFLEEVLPGDTWNVRVNVAARTAVPIVPIMDNWHMEFFYFFTPCRLVWDNWVRFMGEQDNPTDSTSYTIPQVVSPVDGWQPNTIWDHMGIPPAGQIAVGNTISVNALPMRAYNLIYNQWFRDENLRTSNTVPKNDGPDNQAFYALARRGKRHDYFTSALPFVQKGPSVSLPLGTQAPVRGIGQLTSYGGAVSGPNNVREWNALGVSYPLYIPTSTAGAMVIRVDNASGASSSPLVYADLSSATAATINQLRQSFQIQKLLERDARGGTRYTEIVRSHFGVISPDARLQRPEYIGGGSIPVITNAIPQTSQTAGANPLGQLGATGSARGTNGFTYAATEHGYIIGLAQVRPDLTYQQGLRKLWSRSTRYDFYFPVFAMLGEQAILSKEIYCDGSAADNDVFGYQERWAEYRYNPNEIHGYFRSTTPGTIDYWHSAERFLTRPVLNSTFIEDRSNVTLARNFAAGVLADNQQFIIDMVYDGHIARQMPTYSVPGLVDHF